MSETKHGHGFPLAHTVLASIAVLLVIFVIVFLYHAKKEANATLDRAAQASQSIPAQKVKPAITTTSGAWATYVSPLGHFTARYPSNWVQPKNPKDCSGILDTDLEIGPDEHSVITCGSDGSVSQISVQSAAGDHRNDQQYTFDSKEYGGITKRTVAADGQTGAEYQASAKNQEPGIGSLDDGTIVIRDIFFVHSRTYVATYTQVPALNNVGVTQNQQSVFKTLVGQGLQFK